MERTMAQNDLTSFRRMEDLVPSTSEGIGTDRRHISARVLVNDLCGLQAVCVHEVALISVGARLREHCRCHQLDSDADSKKVRHPVLRQAIEPPLPNEYSQYCTA